MALTKNHSIINKQSTKINKAFGGSSSPNVNTKNNVTFNNSNNMTPALNKGAEPETLELDLDNPIFNEPVGGGYQVTPDSEAGKALAEAQQEQKIKEFFDNLSDEEKKEIFDNARNWQTPPSTLGPDAPAFGGTDVIDLPNGGIMDGGPMIDPGSNYGNGHPTIDYGADIRDRGMKEIKDSINRAKHSGSIK